MSFVCGACGQRYDQGGFCPSDGTQLASTTDPLLGTEVGRYRLARLLGEGGMGAVYLGVQPRIGSRVAIKVLSAECTRNAELYQRFLSEARAVNMIKHEHIVGVVDMAELPDGRPYIVMEFIEGKTLGALVRSGSAPLGGIVQVVTEMLAALDAAHALGIVHRDLKPDNVLVTAQGHAKVLDFGIAKLAPGLGSTSSPRTKTGALLGTPAYMSPEQISGTGNIDARTDIYAAGIVLFEAVTGRIPFHSETLFELMRMHLEHSPPSPRALRPELPVAFEHVILTALAKDPSARFQSAAAMSAALQHAARELPAEQWHSLSVPRALAPPPAAEPFATTERQGPPSVAVPTVSTRSRTGLWLALGAALVAVSVVVGVIVAKRGGGSNVVAAAGSGSGAAEQPVGANGSAELPIGSPTSATEAASATEVPTTPSTRDSTTTPTVATAPTTGAPTTATPIASTTRDSTTSSTTGAPTSVTPPPSTTRGSTPTSTAGSPTSATSPPTTTSSTRDSTTTPNRGSTTARTTTVPSTTVGVDQATRERAAANGVHIGEGVTLGPGVVIGGGSSGPTAGAKARRFTRPVDYNPKKFDATAYAPKALALARSVLPDAGFVRMDIEGVFPNGLADLTITDDDSTFWFRSPASSARPAGLPKNQEVEINCYVEVTVGAKQVEVRVRDMDPIDAACKWPLRSLPRCSLAKVWAKAKAGGADPETFAKVAFLTDGKWFFDNDSDAYEGMTESFADQCP